MQTPKTPKNLLIPALAALIAAATPGAAAGAPTAPAGFTVTTFATAPATEPPTKGADDIAGLEGHVFVGWQNGVGTKGEANSTTGQTASTLIEYDSTGHEVQSWSLTGKIDGLGADSESRMVIASVNEDGNSSLYTIRPAARSARQVRHYAYSPAPDSGSTGGVLTGGGTDAVVVDDGNIFISASSPLARNATALFAVHLRPAIGVAALTPTFADNATATDAVTGQPVTLSLEDPDSNAFVPESSPRFAGQTVVDGQADKQLVFANGLPGHHPVLTRLAMTFGSQPAGVDDVRWTTGFDGSLLVVDNQTATIYKVDGPFLAGTAFASIDTIGEEEHNTEVETVNLFTGELTPFLTGFGKAKGLLWLSAGEEEAEG